MLRSRAQVWLIIILGAGVVAGGLFAWRGRPAQAQATPPKPQVQIPVSPDPFAPATSAPQPIAVQSLDSTHFVVVTREPRLVTRAGTDGPWQQMLVTVVTYYSVQGSPVGRLIPMEHVRVPAGYRALEP